MKLKQLILLAAASILTADSISETIFVLKSDGKSAVRYYSSRSDGTGNFTFKFSNSSLNEMKKVITYARPSNYSWVSEKDGAKLRFPNTGSYAYLRHENDFGMYRDFNSGLYKLTVDGSSCIGYDCNQEENIISVTIPKNFSVVDYKALVKDHDSTSYYEVKDCEWKQVANTYTAYVKDIVGAKVEFQLKRDIDEDYDRVKKNLDKFGVETSVIDEKINIVAPIDHMFASGSASLNDEALEWLDKLIDELKVMNDVTIQVDGHSDNAPILSSRFPSNWELSGYRATNVVKYMIEKGVSPSQIVAAGFGDTRPVMSNATTDGKTKNRRIEITIHKNSNES